MNSNFDCGIENRYDLGQGVKNQGFGSASLRKIW